MSEHNNIVKSVLYLAAMEILFIILSIRKNVYENYKEVFLLLILFAAVLLYFAICKKIDLWIVWPIIFLEHTGVFLKILIGKTEPEKIEIILLLCLIIGILTFMFSGKFLRLVLDNLLKSTCIVAGAIVMMYLILFVLAKPINGTRAWIYIGGFSIQLTEIIKILSVILLALIYSLPIKTGLRFLFSTGFFIVSALLMLVINELGTLILIGFVYLVFSILFQNLRYNLLTFGGGIGFSGLTYLVLSILRKGTNTTAVFANSVLEKIEIRFAMVYNPNILDEYSTGYQGLKAREAMALGGAFGSEFRINIPLEEYDMAFVSLILNFGMVFALLVIALYIYFIASGLKMTFTILRPNSLQANLTLAFLFSFTAQVGLSLMGSTQFLPFTGIPLPFLANAGTSSFILYIMIGYIMYIASAKNNEEERILCYRGKQKRERLKREKNSLFQGKV